MSSQGEDKKGKTKSRPAATGTAPPDPAPDRKRTAPNDVGAALRSAYQRTIDEDIPAEMLDLLGRLT